MMKATAPRPKFTGLWLLPGRVWWKSAMLQDLGMENSLNVDLPDLTSQNALIFL